MAQNRVRIGTEARQKQDKSGTEAGEKWDGILTCTNLDEDFFCCCCYYVKVKSMRRFRLGWEFDKSSVQNENLHSTII